MIDVMRLQQRLAEAGFYRRAVDGLIGRRTYSALFSFVAKRELGDIGLAIGDGCVEFMPAASIDTGLRLAHFLAQTATETGSFKHLEENLSYSAKRMMAVFPSRFPDLAFRGRGLIQLTGRDNYGKRAKETGLPLLHRPEICSDPRTSVQIACLYWTSRDINQAADQDNLKEVRRRVNGGQHGIEDAKRHLARAKLALL
jgi:putative chitinase